MAKDKNYIPKIFDSFFEDEARDNLTPDQIKVKKRYKAIIFLLMEKPFLSDASVANFMMNEFEEPVKRSQAYVDIKNVKSMFFEIESV